MRSCALADHQLVSIGGTLSSGTFDRQVNIGSSHSEPQRAVLMRRYVDGHLGRQMLLRMVIEEAPDERVVVTACKTSQVAKYLDRNGQ